MAEPVPNPRWSLARVAHQYADGELGIWTADDVHGQALHGTIEIDTAIQHLLADGYEPFRVTQHGSYQCFWFKARRPSTSATS